MGKDNRKTKWETFKFWNSVRPILEILRYFHMTTHNPSSTQSSPIHRDRPFDIHHTYHHNHPTHIHPKHSPWSLISSTHHACINVMESVMLFNLCVITRKITLWPSKGRRYRSRRTPGSVNEYSRGRLDQLSRTIKAVLIKGPHSLKLLFDIDKTEFAFLFPKIARGHFTNRLQLDQHRG